MYSNPHTKFRRFFKKKIGSGSTVYILPFSQEGHEKLPHFLEDPGPKRFLVIREWNILLLRWSDLAKGIYLLCRNLNQMLMSSGMIKLVVAHRSHEGNQENSFQWQCYS